MEARGSVRVLANGSSWFGACLDACLTCVYWPMGARGSVRVLVRVDLRVFTMEARGSVRVWVRV